MKTYVNQASAPVYRILIFFIIAVSIVLHFWNLKELSLSNDELSSIMRARHGSFLEMIREGVYTDYHPAGTHIWFFFYNKIFGEDAFIVRLPFVIISFFACWLVYLIGRRCFGELAGLLAASAFTFSSLMMQYTQISRMYSPGVFFSILTVYAWLNYLFPNDNHARRWWWLWVLSMIACLHLHYFSFVFAASVGVSGLFFLTPKNRWKYLLGGVIALITFLPELPIFFEQMKTGDIGGWLSAPDKKFLPQFFFQSFNQSWLLIVPILVLSVCGFIFGKPIPNVWRWRALFLLWFVMVFLIAFVYSVKVHPVIQFSTILFPLPFIFLFLFSFSFGDRKILNAGIVVVVFGLGVYTLIKDGFYTKNHFGVFKELVEDVSQFPPKIPVVVNVVNPDYFEYYKERMPVLNQQILYRVMKPTDLANLISRVDADTSQYFAFAWTNEYHPWEILQIIRDKYPSLERKKLYFNSAAYLFSKKEDLLPSDLLFEKKLYFETSNENTVLSDNYFTGAHSLWLDTTREYSPGIKMRMGDLKLKGFNYITATAQIKSDAQIDGGKIVISIDHKGSNLYYSNRCICDFQSKPGEWNKIVVALELYEAPDPESVLNVYIWNPDHESFYADDLSVRVFSGDNPYLHQQ